jgi:hypothetical protein
MKHGIALMCVAALLAGLAGCKAGPQQASAQEAPAKAEAKAKPVAVTMGELPAPVRATVDRLVAGGKVRSLEQEGTGSKAVYDVEATVGGKDVEYDVSAGGTVLTSQETVPFSSLPRKVQAAAARYFGSPRDLVGAKELEGNKVLYEVEGKRRGIAVAVKISDEGKVLDVEKE